jgi:3-phenylpropionate/trans-cinnamate dioxygenase ferredoxin component
MHVLALSTKRRRRSRIMTFVCKTYEIPVSACRAFRAGDRSVLICERNGTFFAHSATCPHQGNSLDGARLWGDLIDCPWHHYLFDVATGENVYPRRVYPSDRPDLQAAVRPLASFPTEVRDGAIFVRFPPAGGDP